MATTVEELLKALKEGAGHVKDKVVEQETRKVENQLGRIAFGGLLMLGLAALVAKSK